MPRRLPYQVGWNLPVGQPGTEGVKLCDFQTLRSLASLYSVARACIQLLKSEIRGLEWDVIPTKDASKAMRGDKKAMSDFGERRAKAVAFFKNPDPEYGSWSSWIDTLLEDVYAIDALSVYLRPTWGKGKGLLGSDLTALELIAGDTIRPLYDLHGSRPMPPAPAYQQYLWGVPRTDLMSLINGSDLNDELKAGQVSQYRGDQLLYLPLTRQTISPYGLPPIERALVPVMSGLGKQQYQLDFYREGCYDDATEILTRDGWKLFAKLGDSDEVATRSEGGRFEWQKPSERQCYPFDGEMVGFANKSVDLLVTPNHRMLVRRYPTTLELERGSSPASHGWHIRPAQHFADHPGAQYEVPSTSTWEGAAPDLFTIEGHGADRRHPAHEKAVAFLTGCLTREWTPSAEVLAVAKAAGIGKNALQAARELMGVPRRKTPGLDGGWEMGRPTRAPELPRGAYQPVADLHIPMRAFCAFLGLYIAEGWCRKDRSSDILIAQKATSRHMPEIAQILDATGLYWTYDDDNGKFTIAHKGLREWLTANVGTYARNKRIPAAFKDYTRDCLGQLLLGLMIGDGHWGPQDQRYYTTTSELLADDVQEVFQKLGVDAWIRPMDPYPGTKALRRIYVVRERLQDVHGLPRPVMREYHGNVYCVTVPNGVVYVRRNGRPVWCGNSIPGMFVSPGDVNMTPSQIRELQDALNALAGDVGFKHKIIVLPPGSKTDPQKPPQLADQFDEVVQVEVCMAFTVQPMELGISPKVSSTQSSGAANQMAKASRDTHERKSLVPTLQWLKQNLLDKVLQVVCKQDDMQFTFEGLEEDEDEESLTGLLVQQVGAGLSSIDEARAELGKDPWGIPVTSDPLWASATGVVPLGAMDPETGQPKGAQPPPGQAPPPGAAPGEGGAPRGSRLPRGQAPRGAGPPGRSRPAERGTRASPRGTRPPKPARTSTPTTAGRAGHRRLPWRNWGRWSGT